MCQMKNEMISKFWSNVRAVSVSIELVEIITISLIVSIDLILKDQHTHTHSAASLNQAARAHIASFEIFLKNKKMFTQCVCAYN